MAQQSERHQLNTPWSIWEHREDLGMKNDGRTYESNMHKLCDFSTIEEFWGYWSNIPQPSVIFTDGSQGKKKFKDRRVNSFSVFKKGIAPKWEDPQNSRGGHWVLRRRLKPDVLDNMWETLVLGAIGETMDPGDNITGVRVVDKHDAKGSGSILKLEVWFRNFDDVRAAEEIKERMVTFIKDTTGEHFGSQFIRKANK